MIDPLALALADAKELPRDPVTLICALMIASKRGGRFSIVVQLTRLNAGELKFEFIGRIIARGIHAHSTAELAIKHVGSEAARPSRMP